nr:MAG TPA: hypothetical protein [Caudoviricetes sp.]
MCAMALSIIAIKTTIRLWITLWITLPPVDNWPTQPAVWYCGTTVHKIISA